MENSTVEHKGIAIGLLLIAGLGFLFVVGIALLVCVTTIF